MPSREAQSTVPLNAAEPPTPKVVLEGTSFTHRSFAGGEQGVKSSCQSKPLLDQRSSHSIRIVWAGFTEAST